MEAFITGVENFGIFCQGVKIPAEGLVHISTLTDDFYAYDQTTRTLTGGRHKNEYRLGDAVRVIIANVDIDRRVLDLRIVSDTATPAQKKRRPKRPAATQTARPSKKKKPRRKTAAKKKADSKKSGKKKRGRRDR